MRSRSATAAPTLTPGSGSTSSSPRTGSVASRLTSAAARMSARSWVDASAAKRIIGADRADTPTNGGSDDRRLVGATTRQTIQAAEVGGGGRHAGSQGAGAQSERYGRSFEEPLVATVC